jgi:hypothetical protein
LTSRPIKVDLSENLNRKNRRSTKQLARDLVNKRIKEVEKKTEIIVKKAKKARQTKKRVTEKYKTISNALSGKEVLTTEIHIDKSIKPFLDEHPIAFKPNAGPQTEFLKSFVDQLLYGGAAGGGKSFALLAEALRYVHYSSCRVLILRRTLDELDELIWKSRDLYSKAFPDAHYNKSDKRWRFSSGAEILFSYLDKDEDVSRYQGHSFTLICFDELTHWPTPYAWNMLAARLRSTDEIPCYMRACVDEGEVLTESGWKDIRSVVKNETVYCLDSFGKLILKPVHTIAEYDIDEELVRVRKKNLYCSFTKDHRVVYNKFGKDKLDIDRWSDIDSKSVSLVRSSFEYESKTEFESPLEIFTNQTFPKFLGWYLAEGSVNQTPRRSNYKVIITQNKTENHKEIKDLLESTGLNSYYSKNGDFQLLNKSLWSYCKQFGKSGDKHFPKDFLRYASKEQLREAFDSYIKGDGHWQSPKSCTAWTTSKALKDDLQEIAVKLGFKTQHSIRKFDNEKWQDQFVVYFSLSDPITKVDKDKRNDTTLEKFKGKVFCIGVKDTENFIIRQKGYVWVSGNTCNPGGVGGDWVRKMFIDPAPTGRPFYATDIETGKIIRYPQDHHSKPNEPVMTRRFIPAKLQDNPWLWKDGQYEAQLMSLPEVERKRLLEGDWDVVESAAIPEFNKLIHVRNLADCFKNAKLPNGLMRVRACDYGYASPSCVLWGAIHPNNTLYIYREFYSKGYTPDALARKILELEANDPFIQQSVIDESSFGKVGGQISIAEQINRFGLRFLPSDRERIAGKNQIHQRLRINPTTGLPSLIIFDNCINLIRELLTLPVDKRNAEDVNTKASDHAYDALRYMCMLRKIDMPVTYHRLQESGVDHGYQPADIDFGY